MKIKVKATNIELTEYLSKFIETKYKPLEKFLPEMSGLIAEVEIGKTTRHHKKGDVYRAEIQIEVPNGKLLRAVSETDDLRKAMTEAKKELQLQIKKYKEKITDKKRKVGK